MKKLFAKTRHKLTSDETQEVITPFAFKLDDSLFGTAIASPYKRGIAILIDLLLIAILSSAGGEFLAFAIAYSVFRMGSKARAEQQGKVKGRKRRAILRFIGAIFILVVMLDVLSPMVNNLLDDDSSQSVELDENIGVSKEIGFADALKVTGFIINTISDAKDKNCQNATCWQDVMQEVPAQALDLELNPDGIKELFVELGEATELNKTEQQQVVLFLNEKYQILTDEQALLAPMKDKTALKSQPGIDSYADRDKPNYNKYSENIAKQSQPVNAGNDEEPIYSLVQLFKGIFDDLGLGFGWAALYFTVFTAWWEGKTPGKKLMGIRVLQLDGTPLSIWDSFGRYGGYGAGIATGLLGFLQIYWDPNRQAMHDQISATVVIDENKFVDEEIVKAARNTVKDS
ncbi:RDD family protein [Colwelliaceae bacterium BS250]